MKFLPLLVLAAGALASAASAQQSPSEVTDAEIARYKVTAQVGCREPGMARGDPQDRIDAFCNCILSTLEKNLKRTEWQQLYFYSHTKQDVEERVVLEPHIKGLAVCRGK